MNVIALHNADINECEKIPNLCKGGGQCVNTEGSFMCTCPAGLTLDASGTRCEGLYVFFVCLIAVSVILV